MDKFEKYIFENGIVTPFGIKYGENYYSSIKCIENKWFELAEKVGEWHIPIISLGSNHSEIVLFDIALPIFQEIRFTPEMKEIYFQRIQDMKRRYFEQKRPKKH